ncbi:MAG: superoxide dismutase family protein, partial [Dorea sp.]|nr:superoxide dismutase family protein [Dorea sp.]
MLIKINENPTATAVIIGSKEYESIRGKADFYDTYGGTVIVVELYGLPE